MRNPYRDFLDFATELAFRAGKLTLGYYQSGLRPDFKADDTPVTIADRQAEELIRGELEKRYPGHAILGEEFGSDEREGATYRWYIDPIDGTKSFMRGVPLYSVLIGLEIEGQVQVGVAYFPALDEMIAAASGEGCWWNGRPARVSTETDMTRAIVAHGDVGNLHRYGRGDAWERILKGTYFRGGWGDAYGHMLVATGRAELMLDPIMSAWDSAPFPPILREAGGYFGDWDGHETIHGREAISTSRELLPQVLELIHGPSKGSGR